LNLFFCDAGALGKRYAPEVGTPLVNHLFTTVPHARLVMLNPETDTQAQLDTLIDAP
jgi:hypothetical protein